MKTKTIKLLFSILITQSYILTFSQSNVRIGNIYSFAPYGIAFVKDDAAGVVVNFAENELKGWNNKSKPGITAPDWSYQQFDFQQSGTNITCEWSRVGDGAVIRLMSDRDISLKVTILRNTWHHFKSVFRATSNGISATCIAGNGNFINWHLISYPAPDSNFVNFEPKATFRLNISPSKPAKLLAGFNKLASFESVDKTINDAREHYFTSRAEASGDWGNFISAITDNLNNTRVYSTLDKRIAHVVSRAWARDPDFLPYFGWDSYFNALLAATEDTTQAWETLRAVFTYQTPEGMIANVAHWDYTRSGTMTLVNSQPPVGALCIWKMHEMIANKNRLIEFYPKLVKWHDWWFKTSDQNNNGLLEWYSETGIFKEALYGTGWDDTPHFIGTKMIGNVMNADAVDLSSLWAMDAQYMALIAESIGKTADAKRFRNEHKKMVSKINELLWNEKLGVYCSRLWNETNKNLPGEFLTRITPANFYPMICGAPDKAKANKIFKVLYDKNKFWGEWILPTVAYDDELYPTQNYWRGKVWGPVNYLMWQGIKQYSDSTHQAEFVRKSVRLFMKNWNENRTCGENYNSIEGKTSSDPYYTWGALLCRIGIEAIVGIDENLKPYANKNCKFDENIELRNILVGGKKINIKLKNGQTIFEY